MATLPATPTELLIAVFAKDPADVELILQEVAAAVEAERAALRAEIERIGQYPVASLCVMVSHLLSILEERAEEPVL